MINILILGGEFKDIFLNVANPHNVGSTPIRICYLYDIF